MDAKMLDGKVAIGEQKMIDETDDEWLGHVKGQVIQVCNGAFL